MKVLLIAPQPPPYGGMALQAGQLAALLRGDGVDVDVFASNFELPGILAPLARVSGVRTVVRALLVWGELWRRITRSTVVHVFAASWLYFFVVVYPAVVVSRARGARVVINYRGGEAGAFFRRYRAFAAPAFRLATVVTAPSEFLAGEIRRTFDVSVTIVPNVLDLTRFVYRERRAFRPALLATRHLEKIYDIESVLKAFAEIQRRHPDATLWIAGSGSEERRLRETTAALNLTGVTFLGELGHDKLPAVYDQCDVYINASQVDNFPGSLLEASAAGLAVASTDAGGIAHIYKDRQTARLVSVGDSRALAEAVHELVTKPDQTVRLTAAGRELAQACEWTRVREPLYRAYGMPAAREHLEEAPCAAG
jgi:glycosyltransferase involved in cell wall biosynthesis